MADPALAVPARSTSHREGTDSRRGRRRARARIAEESARRQGSPPFAARSWATANPRTPGTSPGLPCRQVRREPITKALESRGGRPVRRDRLRQRPRHGDQKPTTPPRVRAIRLALGPTLPTGSWMGSNKSYFGHTLGASGAIELAVSPCWRSSTRISVPPNFNLRRSRILNADVPLDRAGRSRPCRSRGRSRSRTASASAAATRVLVRGAADR